MLREETDTDAFLRTKTHQIRTATDIAEADNSAERMNRNAEADFLFYLYNNRFSLFGEISALSRHKKRVEMFLHGSLSILDR
ncbi:MAG: hypothetical protein A4E70_02367 [Syntrophus sp. PtaU1.Bin005]|nr:MAG: hypothetical protein A4E70_02367 [Syntrophus sp. PtaU1.Bin005]